MLNSNPILVNNHVMIRVFTILLILFCWPPAASADIYKCRLANGKLEFSNTPCPAGSGTVTVRPDEHVSEKARQQAERDVERMRIYVEKREAAQRAEDAAERLERNSQQPAVAPARPSHHYASPEECWRDFAQLAPDAPERAQIEAQCQGMARPQTVYVPVPARTLRQPQRVTPQPATPPKKAPSVVPGSATNLKPGLAPAAPTAQAVK